MSSRLKVVYVNNGGLITEVKFGRMCRFRFSLTVDTGKERYESQGEAKSGKKQGQESAALAMLTILKQNGVAIFD